MNEKSKLFQFVRLIDVFILAPVMINVALKAKGISKFEKNFLLISGIATAVFNGVNYLSNEGILKG